jgi:hypothetical protein
MYVPFSVFCVLFVNVYCSTAIGCQPNFSFIYIYIYIENLPLQPTGQSHILLLSLSNIAVLSERK